MAGRSKNAGSGMPPAKEMTPGRLTRSSNARTGESSVWAKARDMRGLNSGCGAVMILESSFEGDGVCALPL